MAEFTTSTELENWLRGQPKTVSVVIAARAALRVLPLQAVGFSKGKRNAVAGDVVLPVFRAVAEPWVAAKYLVDFLKVAADFTLEPGHYEIKGGDISFGSIGSAAGHSTATGISASVSPPGPARANAAAVTARDDSAASANAALTASKAADDATAAIAAAKAVARAAEAADAAAVVAVYNRRVEVAGPNGDDLDWDSVAEETDDAAKFARVDVLIAVSADAKPFGGRTVPEKLAGEPLWDIETPSWAKENWGKLKQTLLGLDQDWSVWADWYEARLTGRVTYVRGSAEENKKIEFARSMIVDAIWEEGPAAVFAEIKRLEKKILGEGWELPFWDFFLSFSAADEATARKIASVVEGEGYTVFSQFQNMPVGANFVREMQKGLAGSSRFIAVLSPNYESSDHCQSEWSTAYNADPAGRNRKLVPFLIRPAGLNPLARKIIYVSLVGLSDEAAAEKIKGAIGPPAPVEPQAIRKKLSEAASPEPHIVNNRQIGIAPNEAYDEPIVDAELPRLPERQRANIRTLLAELGQKNSARMVVAALENYRDELDAFGTNPSLGLLNDQVAIIDVEIEADTEGLWYSAGVKTALELFLRNHSLIRTHYPLDPDRERALSAAPVDGAIVNQPVFHELHVKYVRSVEAAYQDNIATKFYWRATEKRARFLKDIESLPAARTQDLAEDIFVDPADRIQPVDVRKRYALQEGAFLDKLLQRVANVSTIANSDAGKVLLDIAKKLADFIWSGPSG